MCLQSSFPWSFLLCLIFWDGPDVKSIRFSCCPSLATPVLQYYPCGSVIYMLIYQTTVLVIRTYRCKSMGERELYYPTSCLHSDTTYGIIIRTYRSAYYRNPLYLPVSYMKPKIKIYKFLTLLVVIYKCETSPSH